MYDTSPITREAALRQRARLCQRSIVVFLVNQSQRGVSLEETTKALFPHDRELPTVLRVATSPMTTQSDSAMFAPTIVSDQIALLAPKVAGAAILRDSLKFGPAGAYAHIIPDFPLSASAIAPVGEALPISVGQLNLSESNALQHFKNQIIFACTRELAARSIPDFVAALTAVTNENMSLWLDAAMLSTTAGSSVRSAGLLNGISALTKSVKTDALYAMQEDIQTIAGAVSAVAGGGPIVIAAGPKTSIKLQQWRDRVGPFEIFGSAALAEGVVIAIAPRAIASSIDERPKLEQSREATLHFDTAPSALSTVGTPNTVAAPIRSLWQTDSLGCKFTFGASWLRRSDSAVAYVTGVTAW